MTLLFGGIAVLFICTFIWTKELFDKIFFGYLMIVFSVGAITFISTYFYIYSNNKYSKVLEYLFKFLYKALLCVCFIICIPIIVFIKVMKIMLSRRAKKMDNYETWLFILVIDLIVFIIFTNKNFVIANSIVFYVSTMVSFKINAYSIKMFFMLSLLKIEWDIINSFILKLMNRFGMAKIKKNILNIKLNMSNELSGNLDIKRYAEEKNEKLANMEENKKKELEYDLAYQKATLWKFQLLCLIFLFLIATFTDAIFYKNQSDAINVITVFTLIMLYLDKRRAWDKGMLGLEN